MTQLALFEEARALVDALSPSNRFTETRAEGPGRLLRELVRRGLSEDALTVAAALVLGLDREAAA